MATVTGQRFYGPEAPNGPLDGWMWTNQTTGETKIWAGGQWTAPSDDFNAPVVILGSTTPQLTVGYDASNAMQISVSSAGAVTFNAIGASAAFSFSDAVAVTGSPITVDNNQWYRTKDSGGTAWNTISQDSSNRIQNRAGSGGWGVTDSGGGGFNLFVAAGAAGLVTVLGALTVTGGPLTVSAGGVTLITTSALTLGEGGNIVAGTATGTKIGTATSQKFGLWNATPIVQPTTGVAAATFVANTSLIANDSATFDGYTIGQVVKALRNIGALA